jgi:hypothetical protein
VVPVAAEGAAEVKPKDEPRIDVKQARALLKKERELHTESQKIKAERAELDRIKSFKSRLKSDPVSAFNEMLAEAGISYTDWIKAAVNAPVEDASTKSLREHIQKLENDLNSMKKSSDDKQVMQADQEAQNIIQQKMKSDSNRWELVNSQPFSETIDVLRDIAIEYRNKGKQCPSEEDALDMYEKYLEKQIEPYLNSNKVKSKLSVQTKQPEQKAIVGQKTITNVLASSAYQPTKQSDTEEERLEEARELLRKMMNQ